MKLRRLVSMARVMFGSADLKRPRFTVDRDLVSRQLRAAESKPVNGIKPLLVEDQPDSFVRPLDYDVEPPPV